MKRLWVSIENYCQVTASVITISSEETNDVYRYPNAR